MYEFLFCLLLILCFCLCFLINLKWTKQEIAEYYGVSRKTLGKWIKYCSPEIDYNKWKAMRKVSMIDLMLTFDQLGCPIENRIMTKGEIVKQCETYYHTLRENVVLNFQKLGLSKESYSNLDVFPPKLSLKVLNMMG